MIHFGAAMQAVMRWLQASSWRALGSGLARGIPATPLKIGTAAHPHSGLIPAALPVSGSS